MKLSPRPGPFRLSLGDRGEMAAWTFLIKQGYKIKEKNYRCKLGELDVVAEKAGRLVFVEIKTRSEGSGFGRPEESVQVAKQRKLLKLAAWYLKEKKKWGTPVSFDVLAVTWKQAKGPEFRLIPNAFMADD